MARHSNMADVEYLVTDFADFALGILCFQDMIVESSKSFRSSACPYPYDHVMRGYNHGGVENEAALGAVI
jgi:hypothetical protein